MENRKKSRLWIALLALCLFAGVLRFYDLGYMDIRGDEIELLEFMRGGYQPLQYWNYHWEKFQSHDQMPVPRVVACAFVRYLNLPEETIYLRMPFAIVGILAVPALWILGRQFGGSRLGWVMAFLGCINTYILYWSRFAHVYAYPLTFITWSAAFVAGEARSVGKPNGKTFGWLIGVCASSILAAYTHISTWPGLGLLWLFLIGLAFRNRKEPGGKGTLIWTLIFFAVWVASIVPWAWQFMQHQLDKREAMSQAGLSYDNPDNRFPSLWKLPFVMTWGGSMARFPVTLILLVTGLVAGWHSDKTRNASIVAFVFAFLVFTASTLMQYFAAGNHFIMRYYSPLWPFFMLLTGLALVFLAGKAAAFLSSRIRWMDAGKTLVILCILLGLFMAWPVRCVLALPGNPDPYTLTSRWLDDNFKKATPIMCDGMLQVLHSWRELAPTNVIITFTVPEVGFEMWVNNRWRETARDFCLKFNDAPLVERGRDFYRVPGIGSWKWPREYFRRAHAITNVPGVALREMVLATEGYYGPDTNHLISEVFYNLPEDVVDIAREQGKEAVAIWGKGWNYTKTQDYRDWRMLEGTAIVDLYNLTDTNRETALVIRGVAVGGPKRVQSNRGTNTDFEDRKFVEWRQELTLPTGHTELLLADPVWEMGKVPLLVESMRVE